MKIRNQKFVVKMKNGETRVFKTKSTAEFFCKEYKEKIESMTMIEG